MEDIKLRLNAGDTELRSYVVEQGIPVLPMSPDDVDKLVLLDEFGKIIPASIEHDGRNEYDQTVWVRIAAAIDVPAGGSRDFTIKYEQQPAEKLWEHLRIKRSEETISLANSYFKMTLADPGYLKLETGAGTVFDGDIDFQLWPDARSLVGAGAGTCRLAFFTPEGYTVEEETPDRCLVVLKGHVPKYAAYTGDPKNLDPEARFLCELEIIVYSFSPVIRLRWRIENYTVWQAYLERYTLKLPLAGGSSPADGKKSDDGKFLDWIFVGTPGGSIALTAPFVEALGAGAGINLERRQNLGDLTLDDVAGYAGDGIFEPHKYLAANEDAGTGLDLVIGGVNLPMDGNPAADNPEVHRLFYLGMGRTFEGSIIVGADAAQVQNELNRSYFILDPDYYSKTGALPENGDPVTFGEFKDQVFSAAEWMLDEQWKGTLWWGEWWREYDVFRKQGVESTANGNNPLGPLYHFWRTGDERFVTCAKRSMEFVYDVQLSKRRGGLGPFFHSRRYLMDMMEWVHMRYQRIDGPMKAAHFLGDRRVRTKIIDAMRIYSDNLVMPDGAPGYGQGGANGTAVQAGSDCTNFQEVLVICWRETGESHFLEKAVKMADWTICEMDKWNWEENVGNSYGWHFLMRGMLSTITATGEGRFRDWYIDMAHKNMTYDIGDIRFVHWMNWLIGEAHRMTGEDWMLDVLKKNTMIELKEGVVLNLQPYPWSKWPSGWHRIYDMKCIVAYVPLLAARRKAAGMD